MKQLDSLRSTFNLIGCRKKRRFGKVTLKVRKVLKRVFRPAVR